MDISLQWSKWLGPNFIIIFLPIFQSWWCKIWACKMTFWQENYPFIKDIYIVRNTRMMEWMENVEKSISRILADKVYTSAEFKRERDNFQVSINTTYLLVLYGEYYTIIFFNYQSLSFRHWSKILNVPKSRNGSNKFLKFWWQNVEKKKEQNRLPN